MSQQEIQQLQDRIFCLEAIMNAISEGVLLTDRDCRVTAFNPANEEMEKMRGGDAVGKAGRDAYAHAGKEVPAHKRVFDTREPIIDAYRPHTCAGDAPIYIRYSTYPIIRGDEVLGVATISHNETPLKQLLRETAELKQQLGKAPTAPAQQGAPSHFSNIIGSSPEMSAVIRDAQIVAAMDTSLLLTGETGTGKEMLAQSIHNYGRPGKKFVAANCAAIPEKLVESILFGSAKNDSTGAVDTAGLFEQAGDGTLFLDEIGFMSTVMQAKLLRALQERCVRPVGSAREIPIRCRLIFASNAQPQALVQQGHLRLDLFYRISGFSLFLPPLRKRRDDIVELAYSFMRENNREFQKSIRALSSELEHRLWANDWPGNIRELRHFMQNIMLRAPETARTLQVYDIPAHLQDVLGSPGRAPAAPERYLDTPDLNEALSQLQREIILHNLAQCGNNMTRAAKRMGIQRQNLLVRMKRLGIEKAPL